jgi:hypothetical protein
MQLDRQKFKALFLYICSKADPSTLGSTKLNKILWLTDFRSYYETGEPVTGAKYIKRQYGPVPAPIVAVRRELEEEGLLIVKPSEFHGHEKHDYIAVRPPEMDAFSDEERKIVDNVIHFVCNQNTARSISDLSHDHIWKAAEDGEELPYFTIFSVPAQITEADREWALAELESMAS